MFKLISDFKPTGDQPQAIRKLVNGLKNGYRFQTLLGITGSGKTYTMVEVISRIQRPALVISPNKTLAAQLYHEFKTFFPLNAVHYFVSYYDYYQPEAYIPETDTYIAKDARINEFLDQLRHAALQSALTRRDFIIVSSVSCIYGIGDPEEYEKIGMELKVGDIVKLKDLKNGLKILQYEKLGNEIRSGSFRILDNVIEIILPDGNELIEIILEKNIIKEIKRFPVLKKFEGKFSLVIKRDNFTNLEKIKIYPAKFFVTEREKLDLAIVNIKKELSNRYWELLKEGKVVEAERLRRRTLFDIHLLETKGYCPGIENYSRHLSFRKEGEPPYTILDYLPEDTIIFIDESHLSIPQLKAMARGDKRRKISLIEYGWRLPSALDNRPLTLEEFLNKNFQIIFVSATPGKFERKLSSQIVEQLIRPTFIPDPKIEIRPSENQIFDLLKEIKERVKRKQRILILTLTKRSAENLTEFLLNQGFNVDYLHSDIKTLKRPGIIRKLRKGEIDILVGINLLREGLDLPEVSLVCILDADKEGFLRNSTTLIQAIGRASRNVNGKVILYADKITKSMEEAINETNRRRKYQLEYNKKYNVKPRPIIKEMQKTILEEFEEKEEMVTKEELLIFLETEKNNL
jgi:excinuclease ABC subunit B